MKPCWTFLAALSTIALIWTATAQTTSRDAERCTIPPYVSLLPSDIPQEEISSVQLMGRCFLACLENNNDTNTRVQLDSAAVWPFSRVKSSCSKHKFVHECTRGCSTWGNYSHQQRTTTATVASCSSDCEDMCLAECGGDTKCSNPDPLDLWLSKLDCQIKCDDDQCEAGCRVARTFIDTQPVEIIVIGSGDSILDPSSTPLAPISFPNLTLTPSPGAYRINLEGTVPVLEGLGVVISDNYPPVAFLFKVEDRTIEQVFYIWQNDPTEPLQLSRYACHNISVSLAVVNKIGPSSFSPSLNLAVPGDTRRIPNPARNISITYVEDTRVGFFAHFLVNVTWLTPLDDRYLDNFTLLIRGKDATMTPGNITLPLQPSENGINSIVVMSEIGGLQFIMTKSYLIMVNSVGENGTSSSDQETLRSSQRIVSNIANFTCQRVWDGSTYFSFRLNWTVPPHWARTSVANRFSVFLSSGVPPILRNILFGTIFFSLQNDRVIYMEIMNRSIQQGPDSFYRPQATAGSQIHFELMVDWTSSAVPTHPSSFLTCTVDATSPAPTDVRNVNIISYQARGLNTLELTLSWEPPETANGILSGYTICVTPEALELHEDPQFGGISQCVRTQSDQTSLQHTWRIFTGDCLYCQMRANNSFVYGNWTEPILIPLDSCGIIANDTADTTTDSTNTADTTNAVADTADTTDITLGISSLSSGTAAGVAVAVILALVVAASIFGFAVVIRVRRRRKLFLRRVQAHGPLFSINRDSQRRHPTTVTTPTGEPLLGEMTDEWEVSPSEVIVKESLGEGAFGEVYKGVLKGPILCSKVRPSQRKTVCTEVAIKLLKTSARGSERQDFLSEIDMMKKVSEGHNPHVVGMLGCVTLQEPLCLVTELVKYGDLLSYLRTNRKMCTGGILDGEDNPYLRLGQLSSSDLLSFAYQISSGMEYLSSIDIVHRDLACRNILVDEGKVLKITDFGMSRETEDIYIQQSKGRVPFKWMAIESITTREFTSASDVWSYGIVLWEIGTLGGVPYPSIQNENLLGLLNRGYRMERPENCSTEIYDIMLSCWNQSPRTRPTFSELKATFDSLLLADRKGDYIEFDPTKAVEQLDINLDIPTMTSSKRRSISPIPRRHSLFTDDTKLLLLNESPDVDCSPHFSPTPRQQSPQKQNSGQGSPASRLSPSCSSPKKEHSTERLQCTTSLLFPGRRSPGSLSPQNLSPRHESGSGERHRPMSLFVREPTRKSGEDRYVREPTKLANLKQTLNRSVTGFVANGETQQLQLRRGSEGTLNMNSDGYVSFVGVAYSRDRRVNPATSTEIQITVTQDL